MLRVVMVGVHLHRVGIVVIKVLAGEKTPAFTWALTCTVLDGGEGLALA